MRALERRTNVLPLEFRAAADDDGIGRLEGFAAVYGEMSEDLGGFREVIMPGAFDSALDRVDLDVVARVEHSPHGLIGRTSSGTLTLELREAGLWYGLDLPDTQVGRDTRVLVERGDIHQSSFAFHLADDGDRRERQADGSWIRYVERVEQLVDVAPVTFPAYAQTVVEARTLEAIQCDGDRLRRLDEKAVQRQALVMMQVRA